MMIISILVLYERIKLLSDLFPSTVDKKKKERKRSITSKNKIMGLVT